MTIHAHAPVGLEWLILFVSIFQFKKAKCCGWAIVKARFGHQKNIKAETNRLDALLVQSIAILPFDEVWKRVCEQA